MVRRYRSAGPVNCAAFPKLKSGTDLFFEAHHIQHPEFAIARFAPPPAQGNTIPIYVVTPNLLVEGSVPEFAECIRRSHANVQGKYTDMY